MADRTYVRMCQDVKFVIKVTRISEPLSDNDS